ncbi:hypothetical protein U2H20_09160 [Humidisolicoccus flavus]
MSDVATPHPSPRRRLVRLLAATLGALLIVSGGVIASTTPAHAAYGAMTQSFNRVVNGDYIMIGNGLMTSTGVNTPQGQAAQTSNGLHNGIDGQFNDFQIMTRTNAVPALNSDTSSSATVTVPQNARVVYAKLYWQGNTGVIAGSNEIRCSTNGVAGSAPSGSFLTRQPRVQVAGGAITSVTGAITTEPGAMTPQYYSGTADITNLFSNIPTGSPQTINVGNVWLPTGQGCFGGWGITLVYDYGNFNSAQPTLTQARQVFLHDGHVRLSAASPAQTINYSGFAAQDNQVRTSFLLGEGDRAIANDTAAYRAGTSGAFTLIPNNAPGMANATNNIGVGHSASAVRYQNPGATTPFYNANIDVREATLTALPAGTTSAQLQLDTQGDSYLLQATAFSVPVAAIKVEISYTGANDAAVDVQPRRPGDTPTYTVTVTNTGSAPLTNANITVPGTNCARNFASLASGASQTFTCQGAPMGETDVTTVATAIATVTSTNGTVTSTDSTSVTVTKIDLQKSVTAAPGYSGRAGDTLNYTFVVRNSGTSTLTNVTLADPMPNLQNFSLNWATSTDPATPAGTLSGGETVQATASYVLTQADVNRGNVVNDSARVQGADSLNQGVNQTRTATHTIASAPAIEFEKDSSVSGAARLGDTITYTFTTRNTGNVTLTNVAVTDPMPGLGAISYNWPGTANQLQPNEVVQGTATVTVTQAHIDAGGLENQASVTGTPPTGAPVTRTDSETVPILASPLIGVQKTAEYTGSGANGALVLGDTVNYSILVTNLGNVTLTGVSASDPLLSGLTPPATWPSGTANVLAPGQSVTYTGSYVITQTDINAGTRSNTASATGTPPTGPAVSASSSYTVPLQNNPGINLVKNGEYAPNEPPLEDDTVTFTFTMTNTGVVPLSNVTLADARVNVADIQYNWPGAPGRIPVGGEVVGTITVPVTQAERDAGAILNTATVTATSPSGVSTSSTDSERVAVTRLPAIDVEKLGTIADPPHAAGQEAAYEFTVTNSGNVTLNNVVLSDLLISPDPIALTWPGEPGVLAPGETAVAQALYAITQDEVNRGQIDNVADAVGTGPAGVEVFDTDTEILQLERTHELSVEKSGEYAGEGNGAVGDVIEYTFVVTNVGNTTISEITLGDDLVNLSEPLAGAWPDAESEGVLQPNESVTYTANYTVVQEDLDRGRIDNFASVNGVDPSQNQTTANDQFTITIDPEPGIDLTKVGSIPEDAAVGSTMDFAFEIRNSGNVTLEGITLVDTMPGLSTVQFGEWPLRDFELAPGEIVNASAQYELTQADIDRGFVENTATVHGTSPQLVDVSDSDLHREALETLQAASIEFEKTASEGPVAVGEVITFTFSATNTGTVTLQNVLFSDELPGLSDLSYDWDDAQSDGVLAPGETVSATATYEVTQEDVEFGSVINDAQVTAAGMNGETVTESDAVTTPTLLAPGITLEKNGTITEAPHSVGDTVTYSFTLTNSGNVTLTEVALSDPMLGENVAIDWSTSSNEATADGTLAPGETVQANGSYQITLGDLNAGTVDNEATASGLPPAGDAVTDSDSASVTLSQTGGLSFDKFVDVETFAVGTTLTFTFVATNTGNVTLSEVSFADEFEGLSDLAYDWSAASTEGALLPGEQVTATASYTATQGDVDAGEISNFATATGTPPTGAALTQDDSVTVSALQNPAIALEKAGEFLTASQFAGDGVRYTFTITNTGNVSLFDVTLDDSKLGGEVEIDWSTSTDDSTSEGSLAPGESVTATALTAITQAELDAGTVINEATASGASALGIEVEASDADALTPAAAPSLEFEKTADTNAIVVGQVVTFTLTATNTGNVTLSEVSFADDLVDLSTLEYDWSAATTDGQLLPGESVTATANYTVTQADIDSGILRNTASATGTPPTGDLLNPSDFVEISVTASPSIGLEKSGSIEAGTHAPGQLVTYEFVLTNLGNVTLTSVTLEDELLGGEVEIDWSTSSDASTPDGTLAPGETVTATATYALTQSDIDAGSVNNMAFASGTPPAGIAVQGGDTDTVELTQSPTLSFAKTADSVEAELGDTVTFTFTAENTGNVTLTELAFADALEGLSEITYDWSLAATPGTLLPGEIVTAVAQYEVTQSDVDAGSFLNSATVSALDPNNATLELTDSVTVPTTQLPLLELSKSGSLPDGPHTVETVVDFTFVITNAGNVTVSSVALNDDMLGGAVAIDWSTSSDPASGEGVLLVGETVTATATYALTQADLDAGEVFNEAQATAVSALGAPEPANANETVFPTVVPEVTFTKSADADPETPLQLGDVVTFTLSAMNTGNVTLSDVGFSDELEGLTSLEYDWSGATTENELLPGESVTAVATITITQAIVDSGELVNTANFLGTTPSSDPLRASDTVTLVTAQSPSLELVKTGALPAAPQQAGQSATYSFEITNTGNVTVSAVRLDDAMLGGVVAIDWATSTDATTPAGTLAPGESVTAAANYALTQADIDAGVVNNSASASGLTAIGTEVSANDSDTVRPTAQPSLTMSKSSDLAQAQAGQTVTYTLTASNTGNVTLSDVTFIDELSGLSALVYDWNDVTSEGSLLPGETVSATATYTVTQADVDAGEIVNNARVEALAPQGGTPISANDDVQVVTPQTPGIAIVKSAEIVEGAGIAGDVVAYSFTVENIGNVTLSGVELLDNLEGLSEITIDWANSSNGSTGEGVLAPGESVQANASLEITQAHVDSGEIENTAFAVGTPPSGDAVTDLDQAFVPTGGVGDVEIIKTAESSPTSIAGDEVLYRFEVTNTGTLTLTDVEITDPLPGLSDLVVDWENSSDPATEEGVLSPGETVIATASYTLTQEDLDARQRANEATVNASDAFGDLVADSDDVALGFDGIALIDLKKSHTNVVTQAGDIVEYRFEVTNTGAVTLSNIEILDELEGLSDITFDWEGSSDPATGEGTLSPRETVTATASYTLTQSDIDAGVRSNEASVSGTDLSGDVVAETATHEIPFAQSGDITLRKTAAFPEAPHAAGDSFDYEFLITNSGNITLESVALLDPMLGGAVEIDWSSSSDDATGEGVLSPGETVTAVVPYTLTQADLNDGSVRNEAIVSAATGLGEPVSHSDTATVLPMQSADFTFTKEADQASVILGDVISYTFTMVNTGNVTLTEVTIADELDGLSELDFDWSSAAVAPVLQPGEQLTATASYTVTQADVDAGEIVNFANASGTTPNDLTLTGDDSVTVPVARDSALRFEKSESLQGPGAVGNTIVYSFELENTGTVTLHDVSIIDPLAGLSELTYIWPDADGVLAPGDIARAVATYTVTQADVDAGEVVNAASAIATPAGSAAPLLAESSVDTPIERSTGITLEKSGRVEASAPVVGSPVEFTFLVTNTGNVTLTDVVIEDDYAGLSEVAYSWPNADALGTLLPGESAEGTANAPLRQIDLDNGSVDNTATASGTPPGGVARPDASDTVTVEIDVPSEPGPSEPGPSEPGPSEPGPSEPGPSEPGPSEPGPSEPGESAPGSPAPSTPGSDAEQPGLPTTGADLAGGALMLAAMLLLVGAGLVIVRRRGQHREG